MTSDIPEPTPVEGFCTSKEYEKQRQSFFMYGPNHEMVIQIHLPTGEVTLGPHFVQTEASRQFWEALGYPLRELAKVRRLALEEAAKVAEDCDKSTLPSDVAERIRAMAKEE